MRDNYLRIQDQIASNCALSGRTPDSVTLIAVSKFQPVEKIKELYDLGHRDFGESRLQELQAKAVRLPNDIRWHFVGKLQSNKLKQASQICQVLHTIESQSQLDQISKLSKPIELLIELNIAEEEQKSGIFSKSLDDFHSSVIDCHLATFRGLMTIGPIVREAEHIRPYFAKLRKLNEQVGGEWLSMGMSNDFDIAIQEGATHIRVGTSLFGERDA